MLEALQISRRGYYTFCDNGVIVCQICIKKCSKSILGPILDIYYDDKLVFLLALLFSIWGDIKFFLTGKYDILDAVLARVLNAPLTAPKLFNIDNKLMMRDKEMFFF